jgi:hypothetical protein
VCVSPYVVLCVGIGLATDPPDERVLLTVYTIKKLKKVVLEQQRAVELIIIVIIIIIIVFRD